MGEDTDSPGDSAPSKSGDKPSTPRKKTEVPSAPNTKGKSKNLVGKINNLISSDLGNITEARDFVMVTCYTPVVIVICIIFLWNLLQWAYVRSDPIDRHNALSYRIFFCLIPIALYWDLSSCFWLCQYLVRPFDLILSC
jgi:hypothetical protein